MSRKIILSVLAFAFHFTSNAETIRGRVVDVDDGDTITVSDALDELHKIRLAHIDAPERLQEFGRESRWHLYHMIFDQIVRVEWQEADESNRLVGEVYYGKTNVNLKMVQDGYAWQYRYDTNLEFRKAEGNAVASKLGLWVSSDNVDPWEYRNLPHYKKTTSAQLQEEQRQEPQPKKEPTSNESAWRRFITAVLGTIAILFILNVADGMIGRS